MARILLVDDEHALVKGLKYSLEREGFEVVVAENGRQALKSADEVQPDLVVLDLMLPEIDGMEVCRRLRAKSTVPIIMLTARDDDVDKVLGLERGADDYVTKPFNTEELIARIRSHLRRQAWSGMSADREVIVRGEMHLDTLKRQVTMAGRPISLTSKEFSILHVLAAHPGRVFTRESLLELVWGYQHFGDVRNVDVHVRRLRGKIEARPTDPEYILTSWGIGYKFCDEP
ncbi:MAG: response regulator transcription factor [Peptococcaceae bacterium]|nr:response regulator transcription factor [Peptococcaceae bacterium]